MAIASYVGSEIVANTDTFDVWLTRTNSLITDMGANIVSAGNNNAFDVEIDGVFSVSNTIFTTTLSGGTAGTPASLDITSDVTFTTTADVTFNANVAINAPTKTFSVDATAINLTGPVTFFDSPTIQEILPKVTMIDTNSANNATAEFDANLGNVVLRADSTAQEASSYIAFEIDTTEMARIDENGDMSLLGTLDIGGNMGIGVASPTLSLEISGTDAILFPKGTTAQQPSATTSGRFRFNTTDTIAEYSDGSAWERIVAETTTQTLTNKTLTAATLTAAILQDGLTIDTESVSWANTATLDPANGLYQRVQLTGNVGTLIDGLEDGESLINSVDSDDGGGPYTLDSANAVWYSDDGIAPTLQATTRTIITWWKDGTELSAFCSNGA